MHRFRAALAAAPLLFGASHAAAADTPMIEGPYKLTVTP